MFYSMNSRAKGVYYPAINKLVAALEARESIIKNFEDIKAENRKNMKRIKG